MAARKVKSGARAIDPTFPELTLILITVRMVGWIAAYRCNGPGERSRSPITTIPIFSIAGFGTSVDAELRGAALLRGYHTAPGVERNSLRSLTSAASIAVVIAAILRR